MIFLENKTSRLFLMNIVVFCFVWLVLQLPFFFSINNIILDQLQGQTSARSEIIVLGIDDKSLQEIGAWPWERTVFANAINKLSAAKPSVIGLDVLFFESRNGDQEFDAAIKNSSSPVILGSKLIDNSVLKSLFTSKSGFVNFEQDQDGKIRNTKAFFKSNNNCELSFSLAITKEYLHVKDDANLCEPVVNLRNNSYQTDAKNQLAFAYTNEDFKYVSFSDLLNDKVDAGIFKDKIVLIGSTTLDLRSNLNDNFEDIFGQNIAGIIIHANTINTYLNNNFLTSVNPVAVFTAMLALTILLTFIYQSTKKTLLDLLIMFVTLVIVNVIGVLIFELHLQWLFIHSSILILTNYFYIIVYKFLNQKAEVEFVKRAFKQYMNPKLLGQLIKNPKQLKLGGEEKYMTVMFSDIRSFTSISEKLTPKELIHMINDYLGFMSDIIISHEGTIDKYIGDAIMALWNAPLEDKDHELHSVLTSLEMIESLRQFKINFPQYPEINIGIGINTGDMVVGNVGGSKRFDYTVLGDNVNLGSRLEGLTKKYGVGIICTNTVKEPIKDFTIIFRLIDEVKVKGKDKPVKIFEPMHNVNEMVEIKEIYEAGFKEYQQGKFKDAVSMWKKISAKDKTAKLMIERTELLIENNPEDWDGVWKWDVK